MRSVVKTALKSFGGWTLKSLILPHGCFSGTRLILTYHRVFGSCPTFPYDPAMYVTSATLAMHIKELSTIFEFVPLDAILDYGQGGKCAITFDDGWTDNYEHAFPVLKKYNVPATIFLPTGIIDSTRRFWFERIWEIARLASVQSKMTPFIQHFSRHVPSWKPSSLQTEDIADLISKLKQRPAQDLDMLIAEAAMALNIQCCERGDTFTWDQAREMGAHGITFGSHGVNHYILPTLDKELKEYEILESYQSLNRAMVPLSNFFCYPNGDWDNEAIGILKTGGYKGALTAALGTNAITSDPFLLKRVALHEDIADSPSLFWYRILQGHMA